MYPPPNKYALPRLLKACGCHGTFGDGPLLHHHIIQTGVDNDVVILTSLMDMYLKCGCLDAATNVFDRMHSRTIVSWGTMISGYALHGRNFSALHLFETMQLHGMNPDKVIYITVLKSCSNTGSLIEGHCIHSEIIRHGIDSDTTISGSLVHMYTKCGNAEAAYCTFSRMTDKSIGLWGAVISCYIQQGNGLSALKLYQEMQLMSIEPNMFILSSILKGCAMLQDLRFGERIHDEIIQLNLEMDVVLGNGLIDMYCKCGKLDRAHKVFTGLLEKNIVCWSALIAGYVQHGFNELASNLFQDMQMNGIRPNIVTFACILKAFGNLGSLEMGKIVHDQMIRTENCQDDIVECSLVDMYAKCGALREGESVLKGNPTNVAAWAAMISAYIEHGEPENALDLYLKLLHSSIKPSKVIYLCILKACTGREISQGMLIHHHVIESGFKIDALLGSALVHMYASLGHLEDAYKIFNELPQRDVVLWGAMIHGHVQQGHDLFSLELFERMQQEGIEPSNIMFPCIIKACGNLGALVHGKLVHDLIVRYECESDAAIMNSIIEMYSKCCSILDALSVFIKHPVKDLSSYCILSAVLDNEDKWIKLLRVNGVYQEPLNYLSAVDRENLVNLLARAGQLGEAEHLLQTKPIIPDEIEWTSLMTACQAHGQLELGRYCFQQLSP